MTYQDYFYKEYTENVILKPTSYLVGNILLFFGAIFPFYVSVLLSILLKFLLPNLVGKHKILCLVVVIKPQNEILFRKGVTKKMHYTDKPIVGLSQEDFTSNKKESFYVF